MYRQRQTLSFLLLSLVALLGLSACQLTDTERGAARSDLSKVTPLHSASCDVSNQALAAMQEDAMFQKPYIDQDEWRNEPVKHRYIHGGFEGTDTRFSFYLPVASQYEGRFFQYITPVPLSETISQGATGEDDKISFAIESGAYFIETNGGGTNLTAGPGRRPDPTIAGYRANAAVAQYSRVVAMAIYGCSRPYGYAFGGSGGAYRTMGGMENTVGVWDGAVPYVPGSPMAAPNVFTVRMYALRVLQDKLPAIADAVDVGSVADPYDNLTQAEASALSEVTKMGFPLKAWYIHDKLDLHGFASLFAGVRAADPTYFNDFWTKPGYEGFNPSPSLKEALIEHRTEVLSVVMPEDIERSGLKQALQTGESRGLADDAFKALLSSSDAGVPVAIELASTPDKAILGSDIFIQSGAAKGQRLLATKNLVGNFLLVGGQVQAELARLQVGDELEINNRDIVASQTYHRHQVPAPSYTVYDQYRDEKGEPIPPQRPMLLGPMFAMGAGGAVPTGNFNGKIILLSNLHDTEAYPWQGDWYLQAAKSFMGDELDDNVRLWYTDHASHGDISTQAEPTHLVSYLGVLQQALRDLSAWVEEGIAPPATTRYTIDDGQVYLPGTADERKGIQPVVQLLVNGEKRAEVAVGETVELSATVTAPDNTGAIITAAWDFDGAGTFPETLRFDDNPQSSVTLNTSHSYDKPGTYFVTLKAASQRQAKLESPFARIGNLDRVRVVVK